MNGGWFRLPHAIGAQAREHFVGQQQAAAAWLLLTMCEMADAARTRDGRPGWVFSASYAELGRRAGIEASTARRYVRRFEELELVHVERRVHPSGRRLANDFAVVALERVYARQ